MTELELLQEISYSLMVIKYIVLLTGGLYTGGIAPGTGCITADPLFVAVSTDFHLASGSPCINAGDPAILDVDNSRSDMGCYGGPGGDW